MLDRRGVEIFADSCKEPLALIAIVIEHADFDELVRGEADVDFMEHRRREPVRTDGDDSLKVMRFRAKHPSRGRC